MITKHGKPVAALVTYEDWEKLTGPTAGGLASVPPPDGVPDSEIDRMIAEIYEDRTKSRSRRPAF